jgi:ABC-2 type transport system ATP-binding protein
MPTPRLRLLRAAVAATLLGGSLAALPASGSEAPTTTHGCISSVPEPTTGEPVEICYSLHRPAGASSDETVPMVMHSHGWGGTRSRDASSFSRWLDNGFGVLSFDQRGFGESGGFAYVMNPDLEGQDVIGLVDLVADLDWVAKQHPDDPVLGAIGGSYGGGYQFVGAFTEIRNTGRTRFDALAPEITWWDLRDSLAPQEVVRTGWVSALYAAGATSLPPEVHEGLAYGAATGDWPQGENGGPDLDAFFEKNGPAWHVEQGRRLDIPVLFGQGATDNLFNLNQGLRNFDTALTDEARRDSIFVGYNGGHTLPSAFPAGVGIAGDPCSVQLGSSSFADLSLRFLQRHLTDLDTGLTGQGQYHLATAGDRCQTVGSVAPTESHDVGQVLTTTVAGAPVVREIAAGPLTVAGAPSVDAAVTTLTPDSRAFFALSVGTSPLDARIVQNNTLPLREADPVTGAPRTIELPAVAVDVPAGQKLFLTVSPVADMFGGHGSRTPGALVLDGTTVNVPVVDGR